VPAYDDLRTGRLVVAIGPALSTRRAYYFACPASRSERPHVRAFRAWVKQEIAAVDWTTVPGLRERTPTAVARRKTKSAG
jgi:hypothetical protein